MKILKIYIDESGKLKLKQINHLASVLYTSINDILVGDVLITKIGYEDEDSNFISLSDLDITMLNLFITRMFILSKILITKFWARKENESFTNLLKRVQKNKKGAPGQPEAPIKKKSTLFRVL